MPRRPLTWLAVALGLVILLWGVAGLQRIFDQERDEARAALRSQEAALADFARRDLERRLKGALESARPRLRAAAEDPLLPADGLYLTRRGQTLLPRSVAPRSGDETPAHTLHGALVDPDAVLPDAGDDAVWETRLGLLRNLQDAIWEGDTDVEDVFRSLLTHRARYRIATERDLPFQVALVDFFVAEGAPDSRLLHRLLRDGFTASDGTHLPGLQRQLLDRLERFTFPDLAFLIARIVALSESSGVPYDDFLDRLQEAGLGDVSPSGTATNDPSGGTRPSDSAAVDGAGAARSSENPAMPDLSSSLDVETGGAVLFAGRWLLVPRADGIEGVVVDPDDLLEAVAESMRTEALLDAEDALAVMLPATGVVSPADLEVSVLAPRFGRAEQELRRRHRLKTTLGGLLAFSALGIVGLVGLLVVRERRFLALRSRFVAAVSHELRTPLASVRLLAETLDRRLEGAPEARDYPARIVAEADRLSMLVENILSFNRLEGGQPRLRRADVDLAELSESLTEDLLPHIRGEMTLDLDGARGVVLYADPELFRLLLLNLFINACKYNERDPVRIALSGEADGGPCIVRVRDNGVGIPPEDRERIFTEFYRRPESEGGARGFGLGLAICRRIVALHGGTLRVADSGPDGTVFEISLPAQT